MGEAMTLGLLLLLTWLRECNIITSVMSLLMNTVGNHSEDGTGEWRPQKEWGEGAEGSEKYDGNDNNQYIIGNDNHQ